VVLFRCDVFAQGGNLNAYKNMGTINVPIIVTFNKVTNADVAKN